MQWYDFSTPSRSDKLKSGMRVNNNHFNLFLIKIAPKCVAKVICNRKFKYLVSCYSPMLTVPLELNWLKLWSHSTLQLFYENLIRSLRATVLASKLSKAKKYKEKSGQRKLKNFRRKLIDCYCSALRRNLYEKQIKMIVINSHFSFKFVRSRGSWKNIPLHDEAKNGQLLFT